MYQSCRYRIADEELCKDIIHDIFKSIWERRETFELDPGGIENYLMRAVRLQVSYYFRAKVQKEERMVKDAPVAILEGAVEENQVFFNLLNEKVNYLVQTLPERCREVYQLSREKGLNNREIAGKLVISEKTVENQITKAMSFLQNQLRPYQES